MIDLGGLRVNLLLPEYNHSKVEAIPLSALPKDTTSGLTGHAFTLTLFNAERQAGKL